MEDLRSRINEIYKSRLGELVVQDLEYYIDLEASYMPSVTDNSDDRLFLYEDGVQEFFNSNSRVMLLLGDSGSGKTTFLHWMMHRPESELSRIPILVDLKEYKSLNKCLRVEYGLKKYQIKHLQQQPIVILFDSYDEKPDENCNIYDKHKLKKWPKAKCLVACRTRFLPESYFHLFNKEGFTPCQRLFIAQFSSDQVAKYISHIQFEEKFSAIDFHETIAQYPDLNELVDTPLSLNMLIRALPQVMQYHKSIGKIERHPRVFRMPEFSRTDIFTAFISDWFAREKDKIGRAMLELWNKEYDSEVAFGLFCETLAFTMFLESKTSVVYQPHSRHDSDSLEKWHKFFNSTLDENIRLILRSCPLKCINGHYQFFHKSYIEYFSALHILNEVILSPTFNITHLENSVINKKLLIDEPVIIDFLAQMVYRYPERLERLLEIVLCSTPEKLGKSVMIAASNAMSILKQANFSFNGLNLEKIQAISPDLRGGYFDNTSLRRAKLIDARLERAWLHSADLRDADLNNTIYGEKVLLRLKGEIYFAKLLPDQKHVVISAWKSGKYSHEKTGYLCIYDLELKKIIEKSDIRKSNEQELFATSSDSQFFVLKNEDNASLWQRNPLKMIQFLFVPRTSNVALNHAGSLIAFCAQNNIRLWSQGNKFQSLIGHTDQVNCLAFCPDNKLASGSEDKTICIWSTTNKLIITLRGHNSGVRCINFSRDGLTIFSASDNDIRSWSIDSGQSLQVYQISNLSIKNIFYNDGLNTLTFLSDYIYSKTNKSNSTKAIYKLCLNTAKLTRSMIFYNENVNLDYNGISVISYTDTGVVGVIDVNVNNQIASIESVICLVVSEDGQWAAMGCNDHTIRIWSITQFKEIQILHGHKGRITCLSISTTGEFIISGSEDTTARLWSRQSGKEILAFDHTESVNSTSFSPDQNWVTTSTKNTIQLWSINSGKMNTIYKAPFRRSDDCGIRRVQICPNGQWLVRHDDDWIYIWSKKIEENNDSIGFNDRSIFFNLAFPLHKSPIFLFGPISNRLYHIDLHILAIRNLNKIDLLRKKPNHQIKIPFDSTCMAITHDENHIITGHNDGAIIIWSISKSIQISTITMPYAPVSLHFLNDDQSLIIGSKLGFQLWRIEKDLTKWMLVYSSFENPSLYVRECNIQGAIISESNYNLFKHMGAIIDDVYVDHQTTTNTNRSNLPSLSPMRLPCSGASQDKTVLDNQSDKFQQITQQATLTTLQQFPEKSGQDQLAQFELLEIYTTTSHRDDHSTASISPSWTQQSESSNSGERTLPLLERITYFANLLPNQKNLVIASRQHISMNCVLRVYDLELNSIIEKSDEDKYFHYTGFVAGCNSQFFITLHLKVAVLWQSKSLVKVREFEFNDEILHAAINNDGSQIAFVCDSLYRLRLWTKDCNETVDIFGEHRGKINCLIFNPDNKTFLTGGADKKIYIWSSITGNLQSKLEGHTSSLNCICFSSDGLTMFSASKDEILMWSVDTGQQLQVYHIPNLSISKMVHRNDMNLITFICVQCDLRGIETCENDQYVYNFSLDKGKLSRINRFDDSKVQLSTNGQHIISIDDSNVVKVIDVDRNLYTTPSYVITCIAISMDGHYIAIGCSDSAVRVWSLRQHKEFQVFRGHNSRITCISISSGGEIILSGSRDNTARLWSRQSGKVIRVFEHKIKKVRTTNKGLSLSGAEEVNEVDSLSYLNSVAISPDQEWVTTTTRSIVQLWSIKTDKKIKIMNLKGTRVDDIMRAQFSSNGQWVVIFKVHGFWSWPMRLHKNVDYIESAEDFRICKLQKEFFDKTIFLISLDSNSIIYGNRINIGIVDYLTSHENKFLANIWNSSHDGDLSCMALTLDEMRIISGSKNGKIIIWDRHSGKKISMTQLPYSPIFVSFINLDLLLMIGSKFGFQFWRVDKDFTKWVLAFSSFGTPLSYINNSNTQSANISESNVNLINQRCAMTNDQFVEHQLSLELCESMEYQTTSNTNNNNNLPESSTSRSNMNLTFTQKQPEILRAPGQGSFFSTSPALNITDQSQAAHSKLPPIHPTISPQEQDTSNPPLSPSRTPQSVFSKPEEIPNLPPIAEQQPQQVVHQTFITAAVVNFGDNNQTHGDITFTQVTKNPK